MSKEEAKRHIRVQIVAFKRKYNLDKKENAKVQNLLKTACNWQTATPAQKDEYYAYLMR